MDGMIIGMLKQRIERYQEIVKSFLSEEELSDVQKEFLQNEKILE